MRTTWTEYFLNISLLVADRADCRRRKCGAVICQNNRIVSTGYNGSPPGGPSCLAGECPRGMSDLPNYQQGNHDYTTCISLHAEQNAIANAGSHLVGAVIYITDRPCNSCFKLIRAAGIRRVVWPDGEWGEGQAPKDAGIMYG